MNIWIKIFILSLNNLKYGRLKLSIDGNHHFISGKLSGPNANLNIKNVDIIKKILIEEREGGKVKVYKRVYEDVPDKPAPKKAKPALKKIDKAPEEKPEEEAKEE